MNRNNNIVRKTLGALAIVSIAFAGLVTTTTPAAAAGHACPDAPTVICPSLDMLTLKSGADKAVVAGDIVKASPSWSTIDFNFSSGSSADAGLTAILVFFDKSGLEISLPAATGVSSSKCEAGAAANGQCVFVLDSMGKAVIPISFLGLTEGDSVKYQFLGQTAWTSGFKSIKFTANWDGHLPAPKDGCPNGTDVCPTVDKVYMSEGGMQIPVTFNKDGIGAATASTRKTEIDFAYRSDASNAGLFVYIQFFDVKNATLMLTSTPNYSSLSCYAPVAGGGGCQMILDANGGATFSASFFGTSATSSFNYQVNAPSYASKMVNVKFADLPIAPPVIRSAKATLSKRVISVVFKNLSGETVKISITGLRSVTKKLTSNNQTLRFTVAKGTRKVTVVSGPNSYRASFKVK